jgi:hypothetical protein
MRIRLEQGLFVYLAHPLYATLRGKVLRRTYRTYGSAVVSPAPPTPPPYGTLDPHGDVPFVGASNPTSVRR